MAIDAETQAAIEEAVDAAVASALTKTDINTLSAVTAANSDDYILLDRNSTNAVTRMLFSKMADLVLDYLSTKTFTNQVGGSSAATILAQLATLNSNITPITLYNDATGISAGSSIPVSPAFQWAKAGLLIVEFNNETSTSTGRCYALIPVTAGNSYYLIAGSSTVWHVRIELTTTAINYLNDGGSAKFIKRVVYLPH